MPKRKIKVRKHERRLPDGRVVPIRTHVRNIRMFPSLTKKEKGRIKKQKAIKLIEAEDRKANRVRNEYLKKKGELKKLAKEYAEVDKPRKELGEEILSKKSEIKKFKEENKQYF